VEEVTAPVPRLCTVNLMARTATLGAMRAASIIEAVSLESRVTLCESVASVVPVAASITCNASNSVTRRADGKIDRVLLRLLADRNLSL
jgi:hypothetical protein